MSGAIQGKLWGTTQQVLSVPNCELHRIWAKRGGYSSRHRHQSKWNHFYVESGKLEILIYRESATDRTEIGAGESTAVPPGLWHRFVALEDTIAYETYWAELEHEDIDRFDTGGSRWQGEP